MLDNTQGFLDATEDSFEEQKWQASFQADASMSSSRKKTDVSFKTFMVVPVSINILKDVLLSL